MVVTVTLNPCVDRTCRINGFTYGGMNRIQEDRRDVSGKGINVSLALNQNKVAVKTCGLLYKGGSDLFLTSLKALGLDYGNVEVEGTVRENIKLWDQSTDVTTEVNQSGAYVSPEKWEEFKSFFASYIENTSLVVLAGSIPKGLPKDAYRQLIEIAHGKGIGCILDAEGEVMNEGLKAKPFLIKPNLYEFEITFHPENLERETLIRKAQELIKDGLCSLICITLGKDGALMVDKDHAWFAMPPKMEIKCTQGAGDSVVAGICKGWDEGKDPGTMLSYGVAMASGTLTREGTQMCLFEDFERILPMVKVEQLS